MRPTPLVAGACALLLSLTLTGCGDLAGRADATDTVVIGIGEDVPGFSTVDADGRRTGFDIDVARYVARGLGFTGSQVELRPIPDSSRDLALKSGEVDLVVSAFRITPDSERLVDLAGPYLIGRQDLLVAVDNATITGPHSLDGRSLCAPVGSPDAAVLRAGNFSPRVVVRKRNTLGECVEDLVAGRVDAVTGDDVVLSGYTRGEAGLKVVASPFLAHRYGIGLPEGSPDVSAVDDILREMIADGSWRDSFARYLSRPGSTVPTPPTPGS